MRLSVYFASSLFLVHWHLLFSVSLFLLSSPFPSHSPSHFVTLLFHSATSPIPLPFNLCPLSPLPYYPPFSPSLLFFLLPSPLCLPRPSLHSLTTPSFSPSPCLLSAISPPFLSTPPLSLPRPSPHSLTIPSLSPSPLRYLPPSLSLSLRRPFSPLPHPRLPSFLPSPKSSTRRAVVTFSLINTFPVTRCCGTTAHRECIMNSGDFHFCFTPNSNYGCFALRSDSLSDVWNYLRRNVVYFGRCRRGLWFLSLTFFSIFYRSL